MMYFKLRTVLFIIFIVLLTACSGTDPDVKEAARIIVEAQEQKEYSKAKSETDIKAIKIREYLYDYLSEQRANGNANPEDSFVFEEWAVIHMYTNEDDRFLNKQDSLYDGWGYKFVVKFIKGTGFKGMPEDFTIISYGADGSPGGHDSYRDLEY